MNLRVSRLAWVVLAVAGLGASSVRAEVLGIDNADNDPYGADNAFTPGQNGGSGFTPWVELETSVYGTMYLEQFAPLDGINSWGLGGTYAIGRGLATATAEGRWSFLASHGADAEAFCGFNLRTSTDAGSFAQSEILRFGVDFSQGDATGVYYSTNAGGDYAFLDLGDDDLRGAILQYSVTWSTLTGAFILGVSNPDASTFAEISSSLASGTAVAMLGAGIFGATIDERMDFDNYGVESIPEPATSACLMLGAGLLGFLRRKPAAPR